MSLDMHMDHDGLCNIKQMPILVLCNTHFVVVYDHIKFDELYHVKHKTWQVCCMYLVHYQVE